MMGETLDFLKSKQFMAMFSIIALLIGGIILPESAYDGFFGGVTDITRDVIREEIEAYIDQGLGGSPWQTEKVNTHEIGTLNVSGTVYIYILNGTNGVLWAFGTNASTIINQAYAAMPNGGRLFIKAGTYHAQGLNPPSFSSTWGEGPATKLIYSGTNRSEGHIESDFYRRDNMFFMEDKTQIEIAWLEIDGNQSAFQAYDLQPAHQGNGIKGSNVTYLSVHHVYIHDVLRTGVLVRGDTADEYAPMYTSIYDSIFVRNNWDAIEFSDMSEANVYDVYINGTSDVALGVWESKNMVFSGIVAEHGNRNKGSVSGHDIFSYDGADVDHPTSGIIVTDSMFHNFSGEGMLFLNSAFDCEISNSYFENIGKSAIWENAKDARGNKIIGNTFRNSSALPGFGIIAIISSAGNFGQWTVTDNIIDNRESAATGIAAITFTNSKNNIIANNRIFGIDNRAIILNNVNQTIISENIIEGATTQNIRILGTCTEVKIIDNVFDGGTFGIAFDSAGSTSIEIKRNLFNVTTRVFNLANTNALQLDRLIIPFVAGGNASGFETSFHLFDDADPWGYEVDADAEWAIAKGALPNNVQEVQYWWIVAVSNITEADSMRLEILGYGAAENAAFTTETVSVANKASETSNFAQNDVIYWKLIDTDDGDLDDMLSAYSIMIKVKHEAAGGDDAATDAIFLAVIVEYV